MMYQRRQNVSPVSACSFPKSLQNTKDLKEGLLELISISNRGLFGGEKLKDEILERVKELEGSVPENNFSTEDISAKWRLIWTTERETLFIFEKARIFGTSAGETFQPINVKENTLENIITFPPDGEFKVLASIEIVSPRRVNFTFTGASLKCPFGLIKVPPVGQGWFDNVYVDEDIRISKDSRGDVLITERTLS